MCAAGDDRAHAGIGSAPIQIRWLGSRLRPTMGPTASRNRKRVSGFQTSIELKFSSANLSTPQSLAFATSLCQYGIATSLHW
jgi:hypothetical protein